MQNVQVIVDNDMCTGCCECIGACSANNIFIMMSSSAHHPVPFISEDVCTGCGNCLKACPQNELQIQHTA